MPPARRECEDRQQQRSRSYDKHDILCHKARSVWAIVTANRSSPANRRCAGIVTSYLTTSPSQQLPISLNAAFLIFTIKPPTTTSPTDLERDLEKNIQDATTPLQEAAFQTSTPHDNMTTSENKARALRGDLYYAFTPELVWERRRCTLACQRYNNSGDVSRRKRVELWRA